jgi:hypothetical protein
LITVADANIGSIRDGFPPWTGDVLRSIAGNRDPTVTRATAWSVSSTAPTSSQKSSESRFGTLDSGRSPRICVAVSQGQCAVGEAEGHQLLGGESELSRDLRDCGGFLFEDGGGRFGCDDGEVAVGRHGICQGG